MRVVVAVLVFAFITTATIVGGGDEPVHAEHSDDSPPILLRSYTEGHHGKAVGKV